MKQRRKYSFQNIANGEKMKIWYDACTGKHIRYGTVIAKRLRKLGHSVILTTRRHPDTLKLAEILKEKFISVGKYNPESLSTRLQESIKRTLEFSKLFKNNAPDIAISHQSVDLCRVAFGLGIPIILTADTPHATAVNKLTLPLADTIVASEAIPKRLIKKYGAQKIVQFKGVDEASWIKDFTPPEQLEFKKPLIVVRQMEIKACYALGKNDITLKIAKKLTSIGNVLFLPRYGELKYKGITIPDKFVDSANLVAQADLVVSVGGTIAREAALQGTPSIVLSRFSRTPVNRYLSKRGFPIFMTKTSEVLTYAKKYLGKKFDVKAKLKKMENPVDIIEKVLQKNQFNLRQKIKNRQDILK